MSSIENKIAEEREVIKELEKRIDALMDTIRGDLEPLQKELRDAVASYESMAIELGKKRLDNAPYKCGTANIKIAGGTIKISVPKNVKWDEDELLNIEKMIMEANQNPKDYIKYKMSVSEKDYDTFPDAIKEVFKRARIVEQGKPKVEFKEDK